MSHLTFHQVSIADVLGHIGSHSPPSTLGSQLDRLRDGTTGTVDYRRRAEQAETALLRLAATVRCVDGLAAYASIRFTRVPAIEALAVRLACPHGAVVVASLQRFQPWATSWPEHGLAAVYGWLEAMGEAPAVRHEEASLAQAFRAGKAKRARTLAAGLVADAEVAVSTWVERWNRKVPLAA